MTDFATPLTDAEPRTLTTRSGLSITVRPALPMDEAGLADFFHHVAQEDLRFRFLSGLKEVPRATLWSLTHVDHRQTENLLAFDADGTLVASAMIACNATLTIAEVAISVRGDRKGSGIGWALLSQAATLARDRGVKTLQCIEHRDNHAAIALERELGFTARVDPDDASIMIVEATLNP